MWNDKETDVDLLGNDKIAQTVIEIINDKNLRPLTIGVYGDWGVGKSSVLALLQKKMREEQVHNKSKAHFIVFNGWLFQGYEDAKSALMETIVTELAEIQPNHKKVQKLAKSLLKRVNWLKVAKVSSNALITALTGIPTPGLISEALGAIKKGKELMSTKEEGKAETNITIENKSGESFIKEYKEETITGQIHAFRDEFKELIKNSKADHIVVLVDDLDRCLPKSVIEVLEAIRLFLFVEGTTFVISADERMIEYAVREHFPNLPSSYSDYTKNYLEKLIQIPLRIPLLNNLQTGNYIKFLMLQNHLDHNYVELEKVYSAFNNKKKTPYENIELSYQVITEVLGKDDSKLKDSIYVGDQLSITLSIGLKGNPRNIKRFLNTLFLRIKIARIYGLQDIVKLSILAKLMLLERFQPDKFEALLNEISLSQDGFSTTIAEMESTVTETPTDKIKKPSNDYSEEKVEPKFMDWISLEPSLTKVDLRPYIFISREKAIGFDSDIPFPDHLKSLFEQLNSGAQMALKGAEKNIEKLSIDDATIIFNKLESESRSVDDVKNIPNSINGLLRIVQYHSSLEDRLITLVGSFPISNLGVWAVSQFTGLKNPNAVANFKKLISGWANQDENRNLKSISVQTLKTMN